MKIGIMQPYIFPYIGYFQLVNTCDVFVFYDDVHYIKNGWIDRNRILSNNTATYFKVPLSKASSFTNICDTQIHKDEYDKWLLKFIKTLQNCYGKAPHYANTIDIVLKILTTKHETISQLAIHSVTELSKQLHLNTIFKTSSNTYNNKHLSRDDRLIDICHQEGGSHYINMEGGRHLYSESYFQKNNMTLNFLQPELREYKQNKNTFISGLSIIDVLMFNSTDSIYKNLL
jgi:hypothetical protein